MSLPYTTNFIKENLRLYSPAPGVFTREALKDHKIGDIEIKKGWFVGSFFRWSFLDPEVFVNPLEIIPERWETDAMKNLHPF